MRQAGVWICLFAPGFMVQSTQVSLLARLERLFYGVCLVAYTLLPSL